MELMEAIQYSLQSINFVTGVVLLFLVFKSIQAMMQAYKDNATYEDMKNNPDKTGISKFYYGVILSITSVIVFFLPYFFK